MCEFKKTKENPPIALKNAALKNSAYTTWDEAKKEWEFDKYYYNTTQRVCCPCSLREIKHIVAIKNKITNKVLEIDIKCAEIYFGFREGKKIKESIQRLCRNIDLGMDRVALDYLFRNRCIGNISYNDYEIAKMRRESKHYYSDRIINARQEINHILMNYTNYEHKEKLKQIDYMIGVSEEYPLLNVDSLITARQTFLINGVVNMEELHEFMKITGKYGAYYSEKQKVRILDEYFNRRWHNALSRFVDEREYWDKITYFTTLTTKEEAKERVMSKKRTRKPKMSKVENEIQNINLAEGLEDTVIDLNSDDCIDYYGDDWDEENFDESKFAFGTESMHRKFMNILYEWIIEDMKKKEIRKTKLSTNQSYSLEDVVYFIDIPIITKIFKEVSCSSFYQLMVEEGLSLKYSCQILDWLIRNSDKGVKKSKMATMKNMLRRYGFKLMHNDKITRILPSNDEEQIFLTF